MTTLRPELTSEELSDARAAWSTMRRRQPLPTQYLPAARKVATYALACALAHDEPADACPLFLHPDGGREGHKDVRGNNTLHTVENLGAWLTANTQRTRVKGTGAMFAPGHSKAGDPNAPGDHQRMEDQAVAVGWMILDADGVGDWGDLFRVLAGHGAASVRWRSSNHCPKGCEKHPSGACKWHAALPLRSPWTPPATLTAARTRWKGELYPAARFVLSVVAELTGKGFDPATDQMLSRFYAGAPTPGHGNVSREIATVPGIGLDVEALWNALIDLGVEDAPAVRAERERTERQAEPAGAWETDDGEPPMVRAFIAAGWYRHRLTNGKHAVDCPFEHLHSAGEFPTDDTVLFPDGTLCCSHSHPEGRGKGGMSAVRDALPPAALAEFKAAWAEKLERERVKARGGRKAIPVPRVAAIAGMQVVNGTATAGEVVDMETGEVTTVNAGGHRLLTSTTSGMRPPAPRSSDDDEGQHTPGPTKRVTADDVTGIIDEGTTGHGGKASDDWRELLTVDDKHRPWHTLHNVQVTLAHDPAWRGCAAYDERGDRVLWIKEPPFDADYAGDKRALPREVIGADHARVAGWMDRHAGLRIGSDVAGAAVDLVARQHTLDPVRDYLDGLTWDGVPRLATFLHRYFGAEDTKLHGAIGAAWLVSAVARTYQPGCQADHVLVLEGDQGIKKSSGLRALVGDAWFADELPDVRSKEAGIHLQGLWVVEMGELDALKRAEVSALKAFVTRRDDRYRGVFEKRSTSHPRRCVCTATTNEETYLRDMTGARRWWCARCGVVGGVDVEAIKRDRAVIWAEATAAYRRGDAWHITDPALAAEVAEAQAMRQEVHPWEEKIARYCIGKGSVTTNTLLAYACDKPVGQWTKADEMTVAGILRGMKWTRRQVREGSERVWRYSPPETPADATSPTQPPSPAAPDPEPQANPFEADPFGDDFVPA